MIDLVEKNGFQTNLKNVLNFKFHPMQIYLKPIRFNMIYSGSIWMNLHRNNSDWRFGLDQFDLGLIRIHTDWVGLIRNRLASNEIQNVFWYISEQFRVIQNQILKLFEIADSLELNSIPNLSLAKLRREIES